MIGLQNVHGNSLTMKCNYLLPIIDARVVPGTVNHTDKLQGPLSSVS